MQKIYDDPELYCLGSNLESEKDYSGMTEAKNRKELIIMLSGEYLKDGRSAVERSRMFYYDLCDLYSAIEALNELLEDEEDEEFPDVEKMGQDGTYLCKTTIGAITTLLICFYSEIKKLGVTVDEQLLKQNQVVSDFLSKSKLHTLPEQKPLDKLLEEWNQGRPKRILMLLEEKGFITKNGDVYNWKIDNENDYPKNLYVYFVYIASEKFDWRTGKDKQIIPWAKFNPLFPNMAENQNAMNQYLREIKDSVFPRRSREIDSLFNW